MSQEQELEGFLEELRYSGRPILVEGNKDKRALQSFGINNVLVLKKPLHQVVEEIAENHKEIVLLTDLDKEGKLLYGKLSSDFQRCGVKINNKFRNFLLKDTKLRQIEGLKRYIDNKR